ncbi:DUF982 domain-containing protein [Ochrobactrum sp. A-1]|uniref:DUF982 domain-containing protein n=1 Tax=Ochrobactrum sp. A-1 TaxID=2920940 RepID=UPI001F0A3A0D|nr:DUF982 domain-containing protein [Ochrobactrum sp. A-1]
MSERKDDFPEARIWETPVFVRIGHGMTEPINGPREALYYLSNRWAAERGPKFEIAKLACRLTVEHYGSLNDARQAFLDAAVEVDVLA